MKETLKKVMKRAWEIKREDKRNIFGLCLKMAWEEVKEAANKKVATIKDWFLKKTFGPEASHMSSEITILKETEKAVYGTVKCFYRETGVSEVETWCPKSCLL